MRRAVQALQQAFSLCIVCAVLLFRRVWTYCPGLAVVLVRSSVLYIVRMVLSLRLTTWIYVVTAVVSHRAAFTTSLNSISAEYAAFASSAFTEDIRYLGTSGLTIPENAL